MTRFICSQDRAEIETVKKELFRAGIRSEIRSNPLADALRVVRLELWLEDERDLFNASKLYAGIQSRNGRKPVDSAAAQRTEPPEIYVDVDDPPGNRKVRKQRGREEAEQPQPEAASETLMEASALLEKEIETALEREAELARKCGGLHSRIEELTGALAKAETELARERESRQTYEKKAAAEVLSLQSACERERSGRVRAEEQLEHEKRESQDTLRSRNEALKTAQTKLDSVLQQLQTQQTAVVELRKELVTREQQAQEQEKLLARSRAEAAAERQERTSAVENAERAVAERAELEKRLAQEKGRQAAAYAQNLNSLRAKLQARRSA